jgi:hypothetical protein
MYASEKVVTFKTQPAPLTRAQILTAAQHTIFAEQAIKETIGRIAQRAIVFPTVKPTAGSAAQKTFVIFTSKTAVIVAPPTVEITDAPPVFFEADVAIFVITTLDTAIHTHTGILAPLKPLTVFASVTVIAVAVPEPVVVAVVAVFTLYAYVGVAVAP